MIASPEEFEEKADKYFAQCDAEQKNYSVCGLSLALGFSSKQTLFDYEGYEGFADVVKRARLRVEKDYEERQDVKSIFIMKNMGYSDRQEHTLSGPNGGPIKTDSTFQIILHQPKPESES